MKLNLRLIARVSGILLSFLLLSGIIIIGVTCSSTEYIPGKMDTALQQKIRDTEKENGDDIIKFAGKTNKEINDEMKTKLESAGIKTESIIKDIFTASGNAESIKKVTLLDFVVNLEIAKNLDLK